MSDIEGLSVAATRAGRVAGHLDCIKIAVEVLEGPLTLEQKQAVMQVCERMSRSSNALAAEIEEALK